MGVGKDFFQIIYGFKKFNILVKHQTFPRGACMMLDDTIKLPQKSQLAVGQMVSIVTKRNQGTGVLTDGIIKEILTPGLSHPHGIKVRLTDGNVGRVKKILSKSQLDVQTPSFAGLEQIPIPKTEDKYNEFKEFYEYDPKLESLLGDYKKNKQAINGMRESAQRRIAIAVASFGNSNKGGFIHLGIRSDGTVSGLEQDMKIGEHGDYTDSFANYMRDKLGNLLGDKVFITRKLGMQFQKIEGKTICTIRILPATEPLYVHISKELLFYVRGPTPRAERLVGPDQFKYIKDRFPHYGSA